MGHEAGDGVRRGRRGVAGARELLEWLEPGCTGGWSERCLGTAVFCATRDTEACLRRHKPRPEPRVRRLLLPPPAGAEVPLLPVSVLRERAL